MNSCSAYRTVPIMKTGENVIVHDAIDKMVFDGLLEQAPALRAVIDEGQERLKTFAPLSADVFCSLYKPAPEFSANIASEYLLNKEELSKIMDSSAYKELREYTVLDELGSALGTKALLEVLMKEVREEGALQEIVYKVNEAKEARQDAEESGGAGQEIAAKMQRVKEMTEEIKRLLATQQSNIRRSMELAAGHAVQEVEAVDEVVTSWGLDKGGFQRLPVDKKLALLAVLKDQKKFKDMGRLVGRMRNIAIASRKLKYQSTKVELHSITTGGDISRLLPQELVSLRKPALKRDFYRRLVEKQLMQYDLQHKEQKGQGPIVCLIILPVP